MVYAAVLANIAGNFPALAAALERLERLKEEGYRIDRYYILGNLVGLFPYPREVVNTLRSLLKNNRVKVIRGELDQFIAASDPHGEGPDYIDRLNLEPYIKASLKHTWEELGHDGREFIRDTQIYLVDRIGKNEVFGVYGSPLNPFEGRVLPEQPSSYYEALMRPIKDYEMLLVASPRYPVNAMTRYGRVVCPGSIGLPPGKAHRATFALVDTETLHTKFIEVEYDKKLVEDRVKNEGLPEDLVRILYHGRT
jgi:diadenosine tetraphosphatase ApaH/serine/threonine PP2A family protein phosphatase